MCCLTHEMGNAWFWQGSALSVLIWNKAVRRTGSKAYNILNIILWSVILEHHSKHGEIVAARQVWLLYQLLGLLKMDRSAWVYCSYLKARRIEFKIFVKHLKLRWEGGKMYFPPEQIYRFMKACFLVCWTISDEFANESFYLNMLLLF